MHDRRWVNMPRLMERFGVTVVTVAAPAVVERGGEAPAEGARDVAGLDVGN